jgi:hypothetical protein
MGHNVLFYLTQKLDQKKIIFMFFEMIQNADIFFSMTNVVTGIKKRNNGKEKETIRVSQLNLLKITFLLNENYVTDKGTKDIYLKIIGPDGSTVYNQIAGSGTFKFQNEESLYSTKKSIEFTNESQNVSIYWEKGSEYTKGLYKAELYCEGFKIGNTEFELK